MSFFFKEEKIKVIREAGKKPKLTRSGDVPKPSSNLEKEIRRVKQENKRLKAAKRKTTMEKWQKRGAKLAKTGKKIGKWVDKNIEVKPPRDMW